MDAWAQDSHVIYMDAWAHTEYMDAWAQDSHLPPEDDGAADDGLAEGVDNDDHLLRRRLEVHQLLRLPQLLPPPAEVEEVYRFILGTVLAFM